MTTKESKFTVELRKIEQVKPYERNPRINDSAVDAVAESLRQFGFRQPIVVDADGVIICGHTRWKAAQKLGLAKVPVHVATDLTPDQVRAYRIADNKTGELSTYTPGPSSTRTSPRASSSSLIELSMSLSRSSTGP